MFRRRIRLTSGDGWVFGELEDSSHAFRVKIVFDAERIIDVAPETIRYPMTTCSTAGHPLQAIIGMPLGLSASELAKQLTPRLQCTHLFDLSVLAYQHIQRTVSERLYDIQIPDETEAKQPRPLEVFQDGQRVLSWMVKDWQIFEPTELDGHTLRSGFSKWLEALYPDDEQQKEWAWLRKKVIWFLKREYLILTSWEARVNLSVIIWWVFAILTVKHKFTMPSIRIIHLLILPIMPQSFWRLNP